MLADGVHNIFAKVTDPAGNTGQSTTLAVTIDSTPPLAPVIATLTPDTGAADFRTTATAVTVTVTTSASEAGSTIQLFDGVNPVGTPQTVSATGTATFSLSGLVAGSTHPLTATTTDVAGNLGATTAIKNLVIDTTAPTAPVITSFSPNNGTPASANKTNATTVTLSGSALSEVGSPGTTVQVFDNGGATAIGTGTVDPVTGLWTANVTGLVVGTNSLTAVATDGAGNVSPVSTPFTITVNNTAPAAPTALTLGPGQDTGASASDNITNIKTPTFSVTVPAADVGLTIQIFSGTTLIATAPNIASTTVITPASTALSPDGTFAITAKVLDSFGNLSTAFGPLNVTVDTTVATPNTAPILATASDSFGSATGPGGTVTLGTNSDNYTNVTTPTVTGVVATEANGPVKVQLFSDGVATGTAVTANAAGLFTAVTGTLTDGGVNGTLHQITIQVTDVAGNVSTFSPQLAVTIDTTNPVAGTAPDLDAASDTGSSNTDNFTDVLTPSFTGTGAEPNALVELRDTFSSTTTTVQTTFADATGTWHMTVANPLSSGAHSFAARVTDKAGNASTSASLAVTIANTLRVTSFTPTASGFDAVFNKPIGLADINLYDGNDAAVDTPDVVLHDNTTNSDVRGSLVWNAATNTMSFIKTGGILANDSYTVTLKSSATAFHDTVTPTPNLLDGNGDLIDTQVNDNYTNSFTVNNAVGTRVISVHDFARGPGQHVDDAPAVANSRLAVSVNDATNVRSVDFTFNYDPGQLFVAGASLAAGLPADWSITFNNSTAGTLIVSASGITPLSGTNLPLVLIDATVPSTAPYKASEALRMTNVAVSVQSGSLVVAAPAVGDIAVHKTLYLGDVDGSGLYTGTDSALISRVSVGLDSGFDAVDYTDPTIVADIDGNGTVTGGDATIVAQRSVNLPTPQLPTLPTGIALIPSAGGVDPLLSVASNVIINGPALDILVNLTLPTAEAASLNGLLGATFTLTYDTNALTFSSVKQTSFWSAANGWNIQFNGSTTPGSVFVTLYNTSPSPAANTPQPIADVRFLTVLTASLGTHAVGVQEASPIDGGFTWTHTDGSVKVVAQPAYLLGDTDGNFVVDLQDLLNVKNNFGTNGVGDTDGDGVVGLQDLLNVKNNFGATLAHGSGGGAEALDAPLTAAAFVSSSPSSSAPIISESISPVLSTAVNAPLPVMQNLSGSGLVVGPANVVGPVANTTANNPQATVDNSAMFSSVVTTHTTVAATETHATLVAPQVWESGADDSRLSDNSYRGDASSTETQPPSANSIQANDSFFEQLQADEASDAWQQRTDGATGASQEDAAADDYYESLSSDSGSHLLQA